MMRKGFLDENIAKLQHVLERRGQLSKAKWGLGLAGVALAISVIPTTHVDYGVVTRSNGTLSSLQYYPEKSVSGGLLPYLFSVPAGLVAGQTLPAEYKVTFYHEHEPRSQFKTPHHYATIDNKFVYRSLAARPQGIPLIVKSQEKFSVARNFWGYEFSRSLVECQILSVLPAK